MDEKRDNYAVRRGQQKLLLPQYRLRRQKTGLIPTIGVLIIRNSLYFFFTLYYAQQFLLCDIVSVIGWYSNFCKISCLYFHGEINMLHSNAYYGTILHSNVNDGTILHSNANYATILDSNVYYVTYYPSTIPQ